MKRWVVLIIFILTICATDALAHPPRTLNAEYDFEQETLYVHMKHLSRDHRKHYIRKVTVFNSGEEVAKKTNRQQIDPNEFAFTLSVPAEEDDQLEIKAYCAKGGTKSTSLTVLNAENKESQETIDVKAMVKSFKNKDHKQKVYTTYKDVYGSKEGVFSEKSEVYKSRSDPLGDKKDVYGNRGNVYGHKGSTY